MTNQSIPETAPRRWRHKKRGTSYVELGRAKVQAAIRPIEEGDTVVVYRGEDGIWAVRRVEEFEDGRFEEIAAAGGGMKPP